MFLVQRGIVQLLDFDHDFSAFNNQTMFTAYSFRDNRNPGFTLIELMAVVVIFGIVAMLALPRHFRAREQGYDKKAQAALGMIRSAERQHWMENGSYFPASGTETNLNSINGNLSIDLADDGMWTYGIATDAAGEFQASLTRAGGWGYARSWMINATLENARCTGNCP